MHKLFPGGFQYKTPFSAGDKDYKQNDGGGKYSDCQHVENTKLSQADFEGCGYR